MHHKRRSRRRDKRVMAACGCCTMYDNSTGRKVPIEDGPCTDKARSKRTTPSKERCASGGSHEWVHEQRVISGSEVVSRAGYWDCEACKVAKVNARAAYVADWKGFPNMQDKVPYSVYAFKRCDYHTINREYIQNVKASLCVKCGKEVEKVGSRAYLDGHGLYYHGVRRYIPSREVQV